MVRRCEVGSRQVSVVGETMYRWRIPDAMIPSQSSGGQTSHESICVINDTLDSQVFVISTLFEGMPPQRSQEIAIPSQSCHHLRTDDPARVGGLIVPVGVPYGLVITSDGPLGIQYSRLDTTGGAYAFMSVAAIPV